MGWQIDERIKAVEDWMALQNGLQEAINVRLGDLNSHYDQTQQGIMAIMQTQGEHSAKLYMGEQMLLQHTAELKKHSVLLLSLDSRVNKLDERVGKLDERVGKLDERVGKLDERVSSLAATMDERFAAQDVTLASMNGKLDTLMELLKPRISQES